MRILPPFTGDPELDAWNQAVAAYLNGLPAQPIYNTDTGIIKNPVDDSIIGYAFRYLHIKYADNRTGLNFSDSPTNRFFYGVKNSDTSVESTDHAEYTWFEVPNGGFGDAKFLYYRNLGGRAIDIRVAPVPPSYKWSLDTGDAIDLDDLLGLGMVGTDELADRSVTTIKIALDAVTGDEVADGSLGPSKLDTTGTPSSNTYLNGLFQWQTVESGLFLKRNIVTNENRYVAAEEENGMYFHPKTDDNTVILSIKNPLLYMSPIGTTFTLVNLKNDLIIRSDSEIISVLGGVEGNDVTAVKVRAYGKATLIHVENGRWVIDGVNLDSAIVDPGGPVTGDFVFIAGSYDPSSDIDFEF